MRYRYDTSKLGFVTVSKIFTCIDVIKIMPRLTWLTIGNDWLLSLVKSMHENLVGLYIFYYQSQT